MVQYKQQGIERPSLFELTVGKPLKRSLNLDYSFMNPLISTKASTVGYISGLPNNIDPSNPITKVVQEQKRDFDFSQREAGMLVEFNSTPSIPITPLDEPSNSPDPVYTLPNMYNNSRKAPQAPQHQISLIADLPTREGGDTPSNMIDNINARMN